MATTIKVPDGMTVSQTLHAFLKDSKWAEKAYDKQTRNVHKDFNNSKCLDEAARHIDAFARELFLKGKFTIGCAFNKPINVNFVNFPSVVVERYDEFHGENAASKALADYHKLPENLKVQPVKDRPTLESLIKAKGKEVQPAALPSEPKPQAPESKLCEKIVGALVFAGITGFAMMNINSDS